MAKIKDYGKGQFAFKCPGCGCEHIYFVNSKNHSLSWGFNGDMNKPTFTPSLLNRWGKYVDPNFKEDPDFPNASGICHLFVTEGKIIYCGDCTHELAGKTVDMKEYENKID